MSEPRKTRAQLTTELAELRLRLRELEAAAGEPGQAQAAERALQKRNAELSLVNRALQALTSTLNLTEVLSLFLNELRQTLTISASSIWLIDPDTGELVCRDATGPQNELVRGWRMPQHSGFAGWAVQHDQSLIVADAQTDPRHFEGIDRRTGLTMRSIISVPLRSEKQVIGVIQAVDVTPGRFTMDDLRLAETLTTAASAAIANARLYAQVEKHAHELEQRVTERARDLIAANERLRDLDRMKDQFISRISHELRTPLANIKLYTTLLEQGRLDRRAQYLETLDQEADRLARLIEDLLDMSYLSTATEAIDLLPVDLNRFVRDLVIDRRAAAQAHSLTLECELSPSLPLVQVNLPLLAKAVSNLLTNAINYTFLGGITVSTGRQSVDGRIWVTLAVRDTGVGIDPQEAHRIFDRFYRGTAAGDYKIAGAGLGLSVARANIERLGGRITFESEAGRGSVFTVWLSLAPTTPDASDTGVSANG